jgi:cysteine desulfuration protein SufE
MVARRKHDEKIVFTADSDAILTKELSQFILTNKSTKSILEADMGFIDAIGLKEHCTNAVGNPDKEY